MSNTLWGLPNLDILLEQTMNGSEPVGFNNDEMTTSISDYSN